MFKLFKIEGFSLYPLLKEGEVVLCFKLYAFNKIKINDFVVFNHKIKGLMIKKVSSIENNKYFVKGETPDSIDSRDFGSLEKKELLYKVLFRIKRV